MSDHLVDVMELAPKLDADVLDRGFVRLVDVMPRLVPQGQTADSAVCQAARVSYGAGTKTKREDRGLIRYLLRHHHTSPFEMINVKWHCKMPIFVARQWIRHRTASVNEYSGRYSKMKPEFFVPDVIRVQGGINRQGSVRPEDEGIDEEILEGDYKDYLGDSAMQFDKYENLVDRGLARELARVGLPLSMYTEWYWEIDLHNMMHFLRLRMDSHAQEEIRVYADAMYEILSGIVPYSMEAFKDYVLDALTLSGPELRALQDPNGWDSHLSETEKKELMPKWQLLYGEGPD